MKAVVQRVREARVKVDAELVGEIARGVLVLVGVVDVDDESHARTLAKKLLALRIFPDERDKMNLSLKDVAGSALLVSQFTLCADLSKGARPSFARAMEPARASALFDLVVDEMRRDLMVETGRFGAHMEISLTNDGPGTLILDTHP